MAPNSIQRPPPFEPRNYDSTKVTNRSNVNQQRADTEIRTEFIVQNMYAYLVESGIHFEPTRAVNDEEERVFREFKMIADDFKEKHRGRMQELSSQVINYSKETLGAFLYGVSNELFSEGVTWSRILALFVFVSELTIFCCSRNFSDNSTQVIYQCFESFLKENIVNWIDEHEGWGGILSLAGNPPPTPTKGWAKRFFKDTLTFVGKIALIANSNALP